MSHWRRTYRAAGRREDRSTLWVDHTSGSRQMVVFKTFFAGKILHEGCCMREPVGRASGILLIALLAALVLPRVAASQSQGAPTDQLIP